MTRSEHLAWCKQRAMECITSGAYMDAIPSMLSDLREHEETRGLLDVASIVMLTVKDRQSAIDFVQGFN